MATTTIKEKNIKIIVKRQVVEVMRELFSDPDVGFALSDYSTQRLKKSIRSKNEGKLKSLDSVLKKYRS